MAEPDTGDAKGGGISASTGAVDTVALALAVALASALALAFGFGGVAFFGFGGVAFFVKGGASPSGDAKGGATTSAAIGAVGRWTAPEVAATSGTRG